MRSSQSRLTLAEAITAALLLPDPPERVSVLCGLSESKAGLNEVSRLMDEVGSKV